MIVDFTVTNFRSIKNEQTFSLYVSNPGTYLTENICYPSGDKIGVLKSAGLYGANASGKSNLLLALHALQYIIVGSENLKEGDNIPCYDPYLLSQSNKNSPVRFEVEFICPCTFNEEKIPIRFFYSVAFTANQILEENLKFYPSAQSAALFRRTPSDTWKTMYLGKLYKGGKRRFPFFSNNSFISKAGNSADTPQLIRDIFNFFRKNFLHLNTNEIASKLNWLEEAALVNKVSALLSLVDTGISNISVQEKIDSDIKPINLPDDFPEEIKLKIMKDLKYKPMFIHLSDSGNTELFDEKKESSGTRKLFNLAPLLFDVLSEGGILIMDELDNSMHPFMAELIIKLFNDPRINKGNAQLIFSTHNINLMSSDLLRRDQIWFTEKQDSVTKFYSLDDFDKKIIKPLSPFNLWYAEGRFGAIPAISYESIVDLFDTVNSNNAQG